MALSNKKKYMYILSYTQRRKYKYLMQTIDNTNNASYIIKRKTSLLLSLVVIFAHHPYLLRVQKGLPLWYMSANLNQTKWKSSKTLHHELILACIWLYVCMHMCGSIYMRPPPLYQYLYSCHVVYHYSWLILFHTILSFQKALNNFFTQRISTWRPRKALKETYTVIKCFTTS